MTTSISELLNVALTFEPAVIFQNGENHRVSRLKCSLKTFLFMDSILFNKRLSFMYKLSMTHQLCRAVRVCFRAAPICDMLSHSLSTCGIKCCARAPSDSGHDGGTLRHAGVTQKSRCS